MDAADTILDFGEWRTHCTEAGSGRAALFVHGGFPNLRDALKHANPADWSWTWEQDFATRFRFIWYDRRGCYRASAPDRGYDLLTHVQDIERLLDRLGLQSVHLIGSSAGGPISIMYAATHPARVRSLTLIGTALQLFQPDHPITRAIGEYRDQVRRVGPSALIDARPPAAVASWDALWEEAEYAARGDLEEWRAKQQEHNRLAGETAAETRQRFYSIELQAITAYWETDVSAFARRVSCPTLVVHGTEDKMVPAEWSVPLAKALPHCERRTIEGGEHNLPHRRHDVRVMVMDFMDSVDQRQDGATAS